MLQPIFGFFYAKKISKISLSINVESYPNMRTEK